jgi:hypothetical protein
MARIRVAGFGVSLDGFAAGTEQSLNHPLGKRGPELFQWVFPTRTFREMHGESGGDTGSDDEFARRSMDFRCIHPRTEHVRPNPGRMAR